MNRNKTQATKKIQFVLIIGFFNLSIPLSLSQETPSTRYCGSFKLHAPFFSNNSTHKSLLNHMLLCKSQKLYLRTSSGLFQISSIDYNTKLLTISHTSCSSTSHFVSPTSLAAGFPSLPQPNSLLLFNCSPNKQFSSSPFVNTCGYFHACKNLISKGKRLLMSSSCFVVEDMWKMYPAFRPMDMNCTHYRRIYRNASGDGFEFGTRISFDLPDHVPNLCDECNKPNGNCGIGLRCFCHPKACKDRVISSGVILKPFVAVVLASFGLYVSICLFIIS